jgi:hypothetical protein
MKYIIYVLLLISTQMDGVAQAYKLKSRKKLKPQVSNNIVYLSDYVDENDSVTAQSLLPALIASQGKTLMGGDYVISTPINICDSLRKINFVGNGLRIKGAFNTFNTFVDGLLTFYNCDTIRIRGIKFEGRNTPSGNEYFVKSFTDFYNTDYVDFTDNEAYYGSYAMVRIADFCDNYNIGKNIQWGGDCLVIGRCNRTSGGISYVDIHDNFTDNTTGKSERASFDAAYVPGQGQNYFISNITVRNNVFTNNLQSYVVLWSNVRYSSVRDNLFFRAKAGGTNSNAKEPALPPETGYVMHPGYSVYDTVANNCIEGLMADAPDTYIASIFPWNGINDYTVIEGNKFRRFCFGFSAGDKEKHDTYHYQPFPRIYVFGAQTALTYNVRIINNVFDSIANNPYDTYNWVPPTGAIVLSRLQNSFITGNTIIYPLANPVMGEVNLIDNTNLTETNNSWQGANKLPVFGASEFYLTTASTVSLNAIATDEGVLAYEWEHLSGAPVVIANANTNNTSVSGLTAGMYLFRCTATDNTGKKSITMTGVLIGTKPSYDL